MSLDDVVEAATSRPAKLLQLESVGTLEPGSYADIALFVLEPGPFRVFDAHLEERKIPTLLRNTCTIAGGRPLSRRPLEPPAPWIPRTQAQERWRAALARGEGDPPPAHLAQASDFAWWDRSNGPTDRPEEVSSAPAPR
jgi:dihydroorotase